MTVDEWKDVIVNIGTCIIGVVLACGQLYTVWKLKKKEIQDKKKEEKAKEKTDYGAAIKKESQYTVQIQRAIEELRQAVNADRVQILEFHNGTDFSTRKGYKMDCTYETVKYGSASAKDLIQSYPTTLLPIFMDKLINEHQYIVNDVEDLSVADMSTYSMKLNMGVGAFHDKLLEHNGRAMGILAIQFSKKHKLTSDEIAIVDAKEIILEELLYNE